LLVAATELDRPLLADGWSFIRKTTSSNPRVPQTEMQVRLLQHRARIDYLKPMPGMRKGTYILLDAEKQQLILVSPEEKTATVVPAGGLAAALGAVGQTGLMKIEVTDVSVAVDDVGPGEPILGHPTHRYRLDQKSTMSVSAMGFRRTSKNATTTELWMTTDVPSSEARAFEEFNRNFAGSLGGLGGEGLRTLQEEIQRKMPAGFALRQVATVNETDQGGKTTTTTTTTEVTEFREVALEPSLFEVDPRFRIIDMSAPADSVKKAMEDEKAACEKEKGVGQCDAPGDAQRDSIRRAHAESSDAARSKAQRDAMDDASAGRLGKVGGLFGKRQPPAKTAPKDTGKAKADTTRKKPPR
jgi:hypothetical protein